MSNQGYGDSGYHQGDQHGPGLPSSNPWADQQSQQARHYEQQPQGLQQPLQPQQQYSAPSAQSGYDAPPGPPPRRTETFSETSFVPQEERGEQREAMEEFEMRRSKPESQTERDVAQLQQEFPSVDGSLIAALYGDTQSLGATKEMLQELAQQSQQ